MTVLLMIDTTIFLDSVVNIRSTEVVIAKRKRLLYYPV